MVLIVVELVILLQKNIVITAAHCLYNIKKDEWARTTTIIPKYIGDLSTQYYSKTILTEEEYFNKNMNNIDIGFVILNNDYSDFIEANNELNLWDINILKKNDIIYCIDYPEDINDSNSMIINKGEIKKNR